MTQLPHLKAKYSIFLPVKNGEAYIAKAIESVLAQQLSDFVLIILENMSTDNTLSIIRGYNDPRITVIEAPSALGIYENWRRIYELIDSGVVHSQFSTMLGHDDILYPEFLTTIDGLISAYPDASLYQTHFDIIDQVGKTKRPCKPIPFKESSRDYFLARCWETIDSFGTGFVFRTKDYAQIGGMVDFPLLLWSDVLLIIQLTKLSYKVCGERSSFAYRLHKKNVSHAISPYKFAAQAEAANRYLFEIEQHHGELIADDYGKIALGYLLAKQLDWLDFPLRSILLKKEMSKDIDQIKVTSVRLMQGNTFAGLSESHFLNRTYSRLRKCYIMLLYCCQYLSNAKMSTNINP